MTTTFHKKNEQSQWLMALDKASAANVADKAGAALSVNGYRFNLLNGLDRWILRALCPALAGDQLSCALDIFGLLTRAVPQKHVPEARSWAINRADFLEDYGYSRRVWEKTIAALKEACLLGYRTGQRGKGRGSDTFFFVPPHTAEWLHVLGAITKALPDKARTASFWDALRQMILTDRDTFRGDIAEHYGASLHDKAAILLSRLTGNGWDNQLFESDDLDDQSTSGCPAQTTGAPTGVVVAGPEHLQVSPIKGTNIKGAKGKGTSAPKGHKGKNSGENHKSDIPEIQEVGKKDAPAAPLTAVQSKTPLPSGLVISPHKPDPSEASALDDALSKMQESRMAERAKVFALSLAENHAAQWAAE